MTDPATRDPLLFWLAHLHPAWMVVALALAAGALRTGLRLRRRRRLRERGEPGLTARHLRFAKPAVVMVALGWAAGPASMAWLRGREPFATAHALAGTVALALFLAAAVLGRRLERRRGEARDAHALLALLAVLAAGVAALTGFVLLP